MSNPLQRHQQPRSKSGKAGSNIANFQHLDKPTVATGTATGGAGPRGYSLDQNMRNTHGSMGMSSGKHGNIMMLNKSHNDGKSMGHQGTGATIGGHQKTQSQGYSQQQPGALLANFTKGANLPQHPNSTTNNCKCIHNFISQFFKIRSDSKENATYRTRIYSILKHYWIYLYYSR